VAISTKNALRRARKIKPQAAATASWERGKSLTPHTTMAANMQKKSCSGGRHRKSQPRTFLEEISFSGLHCLALPLQWQYEGTSNSSSSSHRQSRPLVEERGSTQTAGWQQVALKQGPSVWAPGTNGSSLNNIFRVATVMQQQS
jgi:hypothetical protein